MCVCRVPARTLALAQGGVQGCQEEQDKQEGLHSSVLVDTEPFTGTACCSSVLVDTEPLSRPCPCPEEYFSTALGHCYITLYLYLCLYQ